MKYKIYVSWHHISIAKYRYEYGTIYSKFPVYNTKYTDIIEQLYRLQRRKDNYV